MIINQATLHEVFMSLSSEFGAGFDAAPSSWEKIAMRVTSTSGENRYKWLGRFPRLRRWAGEKVVKQLEGHGYTVVNDDFEATVEVDRNDIEDDSLGVIGTEAQMAGHSSKQLPDEIVYELVNRGFFDPCYDGQPFFDTDHPVGDGQGGAVSVSNMGTAVLSISTLAAAQASYGAARAAMRKFKDDEGRPLGVRPNILLVPPALEDTGHALLANDRLEDGKPNPYKDTAKLVVGDWLTSDTAWFLIDRTKPVAPFIYQERKAPVFVAMHDINAPDVFSRRKFLFGAEARGAGGYAFWQLAYGSTGNGA
ncbi:Mu-like prophage major head subunit gpT family protein [Halomonas sp.]|uniref:Mu-like prophage major head subunit gpT family protein n=1 Tax=Halomonas sp. TaxID=1486246 RepID=UPI00298E711F|nr:Mu-like prophage major head subunit gpT family protein [Halomonas sp.]MDW7745873.1 Mu-like prophage major head subunit gpT family protein [Halomonas sp.]